MTRGGHASPESTSRRIALALQAARIGTWHWDMVTGTIDRDASLDDILGIEAGSSQPSFEEYVSRVHPDDQPSFGRRLQGALVEGASTLAVEHRIVRPNGDVRWLEAKAHLAYAPDGSPTELDGVVVDVTERHHSQEARAEAQRATVVAQERVGAVERRISLLARSADLLDAPLDLDAALQEVADLAIEVLADWCTVDLLSEGRVHRAAVAHRDPTMVARARQVQRTFPQDPNEPAFRRLLDDLEPLFAQHVDDSIVEATVPDPEQRGILREFDISSYLVVPLVARGRGIGAITLVACHGRQLDPEDVDLAAELGRRAGAAVEKTRLYAELQETAQVLQASLLPARLPEIPGATLSAHYRSGTEGLQIGGDFYDVFRTGPDRWWVVLGDVCGRGPAAAALTAAVRYSVRAVAPDTSDPAAVLRRLNEVLLDQVDDGQFTSLVLATFVAGVGDGAPDRPPEVLRLTVASAGHPPPLHFSPTTGVTQVPCSGTVVGLLPNIDVAGVDVALAPGETLLFFTDGATEARTLDGRMVGEERLSVLFDAHCHGTGDATAPRIAEALLGLTGGNLRDDLAMLSLGVPARA